MQELGQTLDEEEFIDATKRLYNTLTISEKNILLAIKQKWQHQREKSLESHSFRPELNKQSVKIASTRKLEGETIEENLVRRKEELDLKLAKIRESKKDDELIGCTFHPQIHNSPFEISQIFQNLTRYESNLSDSHEIDPSMNPYSRHLQVMPYSINSRRDEVYVSQSEH